MRGLILWVINFLCKVYVGLGYTMDRAIQCEACGRYMVVTPGMTDEDVFTWARIHNATFHPERLEEGK